MSKKYSAAQRKRFVAALIEAKTKLDTGSRTKSNKNKKEYICFALGSSSETAEELIMYRLRNSTGGSGTVAGYLSYQGVPNRQLTVKNVQEFRHRWVDALIEEFSQ